MLGGILFGYLSQKIGRRYAIIAACVLALIVLVPWSHPGTPLKVGIAAFFMQVAVQGAWGVIPVHLNELSPSEIRGTFPGFIYQLGNFVASFNAPIQASIALNHGGNYGYALMLIVGIVAAVLIFLMAFGPEARNISMAHRTVWSPAPRTDPSPQVLTKNGVPPGTPFFLCAPAGILTPVRCLTISSECR